MVDSGKATWYTSAEAFGLGGRKKEPNMDDLIGSVAEKAGIDEMKAKLAVLAVMEKLDGVLPGPIAAQVKGALGVDGEGMMDGAMGSLGGLLGGGDDGGEDGGGGIGDMAKGLLGGAGGDDDDDGGGLGGIAKGLLGG